MYILLNDVRIVLNFNPNINVRISGPDDSYLVELREYPKNEDQSNFVESFQIGKSERVWKKDFSVPIEFYGDFEIIIFRYVSDYGLQKIFVHRFCDFGKIVHFNLETKNFDECLLWAERIKYYSSIHGCIPVVFSEFNEINKMFQTYYNIKGIDPYKTYNIGRYPKQSRDFKTFDHRKEGLIWFGAWKTFWSYQHPRKWTELTSQEIVDDILGLS